MALKKPFHRIYRPIKNFSNAGWSELRYVRASDYCKEPEHYTRAFLIIQRDMLNLFQYIEPSDENLSTYSFRTYELLMRICIELETNFKAILRENNYAKVNFLNIKDYQKVNITHHLSSYKVEYPIWRGEDKVRQPFAKWADNEKLEWYDAYNKVKHDRNKNFEVANFENLTDAFAGLFALLSSQFKTEDYTTGSDTYTSGSSYYDGKFGIGNYLMIEFPNDWKEDEYYDFDWKELEKEEQRFEKFDYNQV